MGKPFPYGMRGREVKRWWKCGRKRPMTEERAREVAEKMSNGVQPYLCPLSDGLGHWHVGHPLKRGHRDD